MMYAKATGSVVEPGTNRREFPGTDNVSVDRPFTIYTEPETSYPGETLPFWLKLTRYGDEISLYYSPDVGGTAYEWRAAATNQSLVGLTSTVDVGFAVTGSGGTATFDNISLTTISSPPTQQPSTTWAGKHVSGQRELDHLSRQCVDGRSERHSVCAGAGGSAVPVLPDRGHGCLQDVLQQIALCGGARYCVLMRLCLLPRWTTRTGGWADREFSFTTQAVWFPRSPIRRCKTRTTSSKAATASTPVSYINVAADPSKCTLYGLEDGTNYVHKIDTTNVSISDTQNATVPPTDLGSFLLGVGSGNLATRMAVDPTGNYLWAIVAVGTAHHVEKFSATDGSYQSISIPGFKDPEGIAVDTSGNVYVADHDPSEQRIMVYSSSGSYVRQLGITGGSYAESTPGTIAATSLDHPEGIWVDTANNLYVASSGPFIAEAFNNTGMQLRMYKPNNVGGLVTSLGTSNLVWHTEGLEYTDGAIPDPSSITDVYDKFHHYTVNYSNLASSNNSSFWDVQGADAG